LCGAGDFTGSTHFCLVGKTGYKSVVLKCGTSAGGATPKEFTSTQFCPVTKTVTLNAAGNGITVTWGGYGTAVLPSTGAPNLCPPAEHDTITVDGSKQIGPAATGGEYYVSSNQGGVAVPINSAFPLLKYYGEGSSFCSSGTVLTKCSKKAGDTLTYNAKTEFCRDKNTDSLEIAPLCFKTGDTTKPATRYDGVNYICNPASGNGERMCGGDFFDERVYFCYGNTETGVKAIKCKDDGTQYNPAQAFCSYGATPGVAGSVTNAYPTGTASITKEVSSNMCGAAKKTYNVGSWKWEYCTGNSTDGFDVLYCGINEEPTSATAATCKCLSAYVKNPWTNKCETSSSGSCVSGGAAGEGVQPDGTCCSTAGQVYFTGTVNACKAIPSGGSACALGEIYATIGTTVTCATIDDTATPVTGTCSTVNVVTQLNGVKWCSQLN